MADRIEFWTPVGRMIGGSAFEARKETIYGTDKPKLDDDGNEVERFLVTIAIPKVNANAQGADRTPFESYMLPYLQQAALRDFPARQFDRPDFAWKFVDGDSTALDQNGKRWCDKVGYRGHWVARLQTKFDFNVVAPDGVKFLTDPSSVKLGYYVRALVDVKGNGQMVSKCGLYLNLRLLQLVAYGEVINVGIDVQAAMRAAPAIAALPPGASAVPVAGAVPAGHAPAAGVDRSATGQAPAVPVAAAAPAVPAAFPPDGWVVHPQNPAYYHNGKEALTEAALRARYAAPDPSILNAGLPPIPGR